MLIQVGGLLKICITKLKRGLREERAAFNPNPFTAEHEQVLSAIRGYLKVYIEEVVEKVIHDQQMLIFTNGIDRPFVRECEKQEKQLEQLITVAEREIEHTLTEYEKAFLTYAFYNEVEDTILRRVWQLNFFNVKKLCILLQAGQEILYTDLQEIYAAYDSRKIWKYHLEQ